MAELTKALFIPQTFSIQESISPSELNSYKTISKVEDIDKILLDKIKKKLGNKCNHLGYIDKDTISIISRTIGYINSSHFNGHIHYDILLEASVCHPSEKHKLIAKVIGKNRIGIFAVNEPIHIIIAAAHHENPSVFDEIQIDDKLEIEIINYKFKLNSNDIKVIGKLIRKL